MRFLKGYACLRTTKVTNVVNYRVESSPWKATNESFEFQNLRRDANTLQAHCSTNQSEGCKKLYAFESSSMFCKVGGCAPPNPPAISQCKLEAKTTIYQQLQKVVCSDLRPCSAHGVRLRPIQPPLPIS